MKKMLTIAIALVSAIALWAQKPVISFDKTNHDFGKINEADGRVTTVFSFTNNGATPLVLSEVRASCGCTTPKWTREPVEPGATGEITVTYNPNGRPGRFNKTITVTSNADPATNKLFIKGEVIPKAAKPVETFPVKFGKLELKTQSVDFGNAYMGQSAEQTIAFMNNSNDPVKVEFVPTDPFFYAMAHRESSEATIQPHTRGEVIVVFYGQNCQQYGPATSKLFAVIDGVEDANMFITASINVQEDFSQMTAEDKDLAPIADIKNDINLGQFTAGKSHKAQFEVTNVGSDPLLVRRVICNDSRLKIQTPKAVKSGKKGIFRVQMDAMEAGKYSSEITLITNDPVNSVKKITLQWTIK